MRTGMKADVMEAISPPLHMPSSSSLLALNPTNESGCPESQAVSLLLTAPDFRPLLCCRHSTVRATEDSCWHFLKDAQERSRTEEGRGPGSGAGWEDRGGFEMSFCPNYLHGLHLLSAWSSFSSTDVRFVLIQLHSPGGPFGTGSTHQSVSQMARAFVVWLGIERMVLRGPTWTRSRASNPLTAPIPGDHPEEKGKESRQ